MVGFNLIKAGADPLHQSARVINHLLAMIVFVNYSLMVRPAVRPRSTDLNLSIFVRHDETNTRGEVGRWGGSVIKISITRSIITVVYQVLASQEEVSQV